MRTPRDPSRHFGRLAATLTLALALPGAALAHESEQCDVEFDADLEIRPERIVIDDRRLGEVVIREDGTLSIADRDVDLDDDQREALEAYAEQVRVVVPEIVEVALDGVELAANALTEVFAGLTGDEPPTAVREALSDLREDVSEGMGRSEGTWYVHESGLHHATESMDTIEPAIERAVAASVGSLLIAVGQTMVSGDGDLDDRVASFSDRMDRFGEDLESRIERDADAIEDRAQALCGEVLVLADRENALRDEVPELARLRMLTRG